MLVGNLQDMKGGWTSSQTSSATVNPPATLLAVQPLMTQSTTPISAVTIHTVQPPTMVTATTSVVQPKQDTSSKYTLTIINDHNVVVDFQT